MRLAAGGGSVAVSFPQPASGGTPITGYQFNTVGAGTASEDVRATPVAPTSLRVVPRPARPGQRSHLVPIPANPNASHGRLRHTKALYRSHNGRLAVPLSTVRGHQLSRHQAVQVQRLFRFDSASLSASGRHQLRVLAASMRNVHAITSGVRVHPIGYRADRPVVIGGQQKNRVENRRVDVVVTR